MMVSVVIPVYNAGKYISRSVRSALEQPEVAEVLLVNDGSVDNSLSLCQQLAKADDRVVVLSHPQNRNRGVAASRNLGIKHAKSEFIAFLDADDFYLPQRFETARTRFLSDSTTDGVYEFVSVMSESENSANNLTTIEDIDPEVLFENLQPVGERIWFHINGLTVRRATFEKSGLFNEYLKTTDDTHMWFQMASTAKLVAGSIDKAVAVYEKNSSSLTSNIELVDKDHL